MHTNTQGRRNLRCLGNPLREEEGGRRNLEINNSFVSGLHKHSRTLQMTITEPLIRRFLHSTTAAVRVYTVMLRTHAVTEEEKNNERER